MDKEVFHKILKKYLEGNASEEEKRIVDTWYGKMGKDKENFSSYTEELQLSNRYWTRIQSYIRNSRKTRHGSHWRLYAIGLAASALLVVLSYLSISYGTVTPFTPTSVRDAGRPVFEKIVNQGAGPQLIKLPDGSEVVLEPKSRLRYASAFTGQERRVYLNGKAFFKVTANKDRPFKVFTREVVTKVLGTSFSVSAFHWEKDVTVSVVTGKVSVYKKEEDRETTKATEVILTPNQEFVYNKEEQKILTTIVKEPQAILPLEEVKRMRFEDTSPTVVFEAIEKAYGVDIVFDEHKFSSCRITTNISDGNIFNRLLIICEVINAAYRVEETKIIIEGEGCYTSL